MQLANQQLITAYNQSESRFRNIQEDLNEESRKYEKIFSSVFILFFIIKFFRREFAERRSNELYKLLQRAEVGIGIDNRPKPWKFCRKLNIYFYCPVLKLSWDFTNILPFNIFFLLCSPIIYELKYQSLNYLTFFILIRLSHSRFHRYTLPEKKN